MSATDVIRELEELPSQEQEKVLRWLQQRGLKDLWTRADALMKDAPKVSEEEIRGCRVFVLLDSNVWLAALRATAFVVDAGVFGSVLHACCYSIPLRRGARKTRHQIRPNTGAGRRIGFKTLSVSQLRDDVAEIFITLA